MFCISVMFSILISLSVSQNVTDDSESSTDMPIAICQICVCGNETVDCTQLELDKIFVGEEWDGLTTINPTSLIFVDNAITNVPQFPELPLQTLNVSSCQIASIQDSAFMNLKYLVHLDLSRNKIITSSLSRTTFMNKPPLEPGTSAPQFLYIKTLNLAYNDIHTLPSELFFCMTQLRSLDLSGNPLAFIDQLTMATISELTMLRELKLSACELEVLPEGMFRRLRRLEYLDLSNNRFPTVPSVLGEAPKLVYLNLDKNPIGNLTEKTVISNLSKLEELHLCRLSKLQYIGPGALSELESLSTLYICYNPRLSEIDSDFLMWIDEHEVERYPVLKEFYLNNNNISTVNPNFLDRWDQLVDVDFTHNSYSCDCSSQWMVTALVPLINTTLAAGTAANMFCKRPSSLRGLSFAQLSETSQSLECSEELTEGPAPHMAVILGIMIGIFVTFPTILVVILSWRRGYFAKCRGRHTKVNYYDDEENDAF